MYSNLFGQYTAKKSILHSLDPRLKILLVVIFSVLVYLLGNFIQLSIFSIFLLSLLLIAKINPVSIARSVRPFAFVFSLIILMYLLFDREHIIIGFFTVFRFLLLILTSLLLTFTTTISAMVFGLEKLLSTLKLLRIQPRNISLMIAVTIRFIPSLFIQANSVRDAQKSRGLQFKKIKEHAYFIPALLRKIFFTANNLSDAIVARNYTDTGYSSYNNIELTIPDLSISILFCAVAVYITLI